MRKMIRQTIFLAVFSAVLLGLSLDDAQASGVKTYRGKFSDGAKYLIQVPSNWNGTLVLYSHGYVLPGSSNPAEDVGDPITGGYLLANGYALGGSSYATTGWAFQQAVPDQIKVLDTFKTLVGAPSRTIAWGHSLGGMVTAGLVQLYPQRFDAALPMCGVVAGSVGTWNQALDSAFAFDVLLGSGSGLQLVNIKDPVKNVTIAEEILSAAQDDAKGQARIALTAALDDTPGWYDPLSPEPSPTDYAAQEANQYLWLANIDFPFAFDLRAELEGRAGGNGSWNNGVDYETQLKNSIDYAEVQALYRKAGLSLDTDLQALKRCGADQGQTIRADLPRTKYYLQRKDSDPRLDPAYQGRWSCSGGRRNRLQGCCRPGERRRAAASAVCASRGALRVYSGGDRSRLRGADQPIGYRQMACARCYRAEPIGQGVGI